MSLRRVGSMAAIALAAVLEISCGQVYRPVVLPTSTVPPNPANFHAVFGVAANAPSNFGSVLQIDVSGDSEIGAAAMGVNPTHLAILPTNSRVFVTNAGSLQGQQDNVIAFNPAFDSSTATGLGPLSVYSMPPGSLPVFANTTQTTVMYVANFGTNSVSSLNTGTNVVTLTGAAGQNPVALAETPNALNLYVVNQGDNTVTDLSPIDLSTLSIIQVGNTPVWAAMRPDGLFVYIVTQGDGQLYTISTTTNAVVSTQSLGGPGANFALYDKSLNRLYVTNPTAGNVYIFDASGNAPSLITTISMTAGTNPPCPPATSTTSACSPVSVAALADGSRFYVASYQTATACPDPNIGLLSPCIIPRLTVFDALSLTVKTMSSSLLAPSLSLLTQPPYAANQYAVSPLASCVTPATYAPGTTRFRMFTTAASDSSHVYASICDSGSIADIIATTTTINTGAINTPDSLVTDLNTPFAACTGPGCNTATITSFSIASGVVTFQAANNFVTGQNVSISGLTTAPGLTLDGHTLTVLATGLSASQFECNFASTSDVPATPDSGTVVPLPPLQSPIFLLTGQ